jgi:hypothetical protein
MIRHDGVGNGFFPFPMKDQLLKRAFEKWAHAIRLKNRALYGLKRLLFV